MVYWHACWLAAGDSRALGFLGDLVHSVLGLNTTHTSHSQPSSGPGDPTLPPHTPSATSGNQTLPTPTDSLGISQPVYAPGSSTPHTPSTHHNGIASTPQPAQALFI
ncbi:hypothetical protein F4604DRAFT_1916976 [Suillus subluteus]|nr:hypothetical protein F4604DRAFT_1916976 [Suillus subluteus]